MRLINGVQSWWNQKSTPKTKHYNILGALTPDRPRSRNPSTNSEGYSTVGGSGTSPEAFKEMIFGTKINILLLLAVPWIAGQIFNWPDGVRSACAVLLCAAPRLRLSKPIDTVPYVT